MSKLSCTIVANIGLKFELRHTRVDMFQCKSNVYYTLGSHTLLIIGSRMSNGKLRDTTVWVLKSTSNHSCAVVIS